MSTMSRLPIKISEGNYTDSFSFDLKGQQKHLGDNKFTKNRPIN